MYINIMFVCMAVGVASMRECRKNPIFRHYEWHNPRSGWWSRESLIRIHPRDPQMEHLQRLRFWFRKVDSIQPLLSAFRVQEKQ